MPKITRSLPEGYESISRPVARGIIDSVMRFTGLTGKFRVQFNGDSDVAPQTGSRLDEKQANSGNVTFTSDNKISVSMAETFIEQEVLTASITQKNHPVVFLDAPLEISLKPVYHAIEGVLSFTYRAVDETSARQWLNGIVRHISMGRKEMYHEVVYDYPIPNEFVAILRELYTVRESQAGYGDTLGTWLKTNFDPRATILTTMSGTEPLLVMKEAQKAVLGYFDWTIPPTPEKTGEGATYTATFQYYYNYDQVTGVCMDYPIVIHQKLIAEEWRGRNTPYEMWQRPSYMSEAKKYYEQNKLITGGYIETMPGVIYPDYDEWMPSSVPVNTMPLFTCLLQVDPEDPTLLLNLNDLRHWDINPVILDYMIKNRRWVTLTHFTPILIQLFVGKHPYDETQLVVDEDGTVRTTVPMDLRKQYHFRVSSLIDLSTLTRERSDDLRKFPEACLVILNALDAKLKSSPFYPTVIGERFVSKPGYLRALEHIRTTSVIFRTAKEYGRFTVGTYFLSVKKV